MPYCKYCGKEITDGKLCVCPEAAAERQQPDYTAHEPKTDIPDGTPITAEMLGIDSKKFLKKSVMMPAAAAGIVLVVIMVLAAFSGTRYRQPEELLLKGIKTAHSELVLDALYPESFLTDLRTRLDENEEDIADITDDLSNLISELTEMCDDEYFGGRTKISMEFLSKTAPSDRMQQEIESYYSLNFGAQVSRTYKVKVMMTVKGSDHTVSSRLNVYSVKLKGDRWVVYIPEKTVSKFRKDFEDMCDIVGKSAEKSISSYDDSLDYLKFEH